MNLSHVDLFTPLTGGLESVVARVSKTTTVSTPKPTATHENGLARVRNDMAWGS